MTTMYVICDHAKTCMNACTCDHSHIHVCNSDCEPSLPGRALFCGLTTCITPSLDVLLNECKDAKVLYYDARAAERKAQRATYDACSDYMALKEELKRRIEEV